MLHRHFLTNLHHHQILIDLSGHGAIQRGKFVLIRGNFAVPGAERNSQFKGLVLHVLHTRQGGRAQRGRRHV